MQSGDLSIDRILAAAKLIDPVFLDTATLRADSLDAALQCALSAKDETANPIGSFKGRGTEYFAAKDLRPGDVLVCASAGNFGQGLARAAQRRGHRCIVFAATNANPVKVTAMRALGAEVHLAGADFDTAKQQARHYATDHGLRFVEDGAIAAIAEGAGTIAVELLAQAGQPDCLLVPLGNGALAAGIGAACRHLASGTEVLAIVAEQAPSMKLSIEQGRSISTAQAETIADGIAIREPVPAALAMLSGRLDGVVAVSEAAIRQAMRLVYRHLGRIVEPAGVVGIAAILGDPPRFRGRRLATILCGGNVTEQMRAFCQSDPRAEGGE